MSALVLVVILSSLMVTDSAGECPTGCYCDPITSSGGKLTIDCRHRLSDVPEEQLSEQLDSMLSTDHIAERLTSLTITHTPLTRIPKSVCRLRNLMSLNLDQNKITELPDNCFIHLTKLVSFSAEDNAIVGLQDGLFDGLQRLQTLNFRQNHIASIGLRLFSNSSDLVSLRLLNLRYNRLTSVEPWWYYRCIQGSDTSPVNINLRSNRISNFTNEVKFNFSCGMKAPYGSVDLRFNRIVHLMDIANAWNIDINKIVCLLNFQSSHHLMTFNFDGHSYACDCIDFEFYKWARLFPATNFLNGVRCGGREFNSVVLQKAASIPLDQFVCKLSEYCPSSCRCVYCPAKMSVRIICSATNMSSLPLHLPPLPKRNEKYELDFSNNKLLRRLEHRPYFANTSVLDVSNCSLTEFDLTVWEDMSHLKSANLSRNMFQSFPQYVKTSSNISERLLLGGNPWRCSCENSWMTDWLQSLSDQISDAGDIICLSPARMYGKNVMKSTEEDFCDDPVERSLITVLSAVFSAAVLLLITGLLLYKLRVKFYARWKFHPFDRDECVGEDMHYDMFLCCSSDDHSPHGLHILQLVESEGYCVCYHLRDFLAGAAITDNMIQAIEHSKRTVCLISTNFLRR